MSDEADKSISGQIRHRAHRNRGTRTRVSAERKCGSRCHIENACLCLRVTPLCRSLSPVLRGAIGKPSFPCLIGLIEVDVVDSVRASHGCSSCAWDKPGRLSLEKTLVVGCYRDTDLPVISVSVAHLQIPQLFPRICMREHSIQICVI